MNIAVMGTGGTGGYFGGLLARAGEEVTFIARGTHLEAIRKKGLAIKSVLAGNFTIPVKATADPGAVGAVDVVLFCVKAYDNDVAAGRRLELDVLNGVAVRLERRHGIPTPINFAIYAALKPYIDGRPSSS
jgi:2-dehydropantoate 2-reductase